MIRNYQRKAKSVSVHAGSSSQTCQAEGAGAEEQESCGFGIGFGVALAEGAVVLLPEGEVGAIHLPVVVPVAHGEGVDVELEGVVVLLPECEVGAAGGTLMAPLCCPQQAFHDKASDSDIHCIAQGLHAGFSIWKKPEIVH